MGSNEEAAWESEIKDEVSRSSYWLELKGMQLNAVKT